MIVLVALLAKSSMSTCRDCSFNATWCPTKQPGDNFFLHDASTSPNRDAPKPMDSVRSFYVQRDVRTSAHLYCLWSLRCGSGTRALCRDARSGNRCEGPLRVWSLCAWRTRCGSSTHGISLLLVRNLAWRMFLMSNGRLASRLVHQSLFRLHRSRTSVEIPGSSVQCRGGEQALRWTAGSLVSGSEQVERFSSPPCADTSLLHSRPSSLRAPLGFILVEPLLPSPLRDRAASDHGPGPQCYLGGSSLHGGPQMLTNGQQRTFRDPLLITRANIHSCLRKFGFRTPFLWRARQPRRLTHRKSQTI